MARYRGALCRLCRREGMQLYLKASRCYTEKCAFKKKGYAPGQHGLRRLRPSEFRNQLREKQKVKRMYGVFERQFRKYFHMAEKLHGVTGDNLLMLLEKRLDNVLYRAGIAQSRNEARNLINHRHIMLNKHRVDIPSIQVKAGDEIEVLKKGLVPVLNAVQTKEKAAIPEWLSLDDQNLKVQVLAEPKRENITAEINERLIVELYSK